MIEVVNSIQKLETPVSALEAYAALRKTHAADQLFLLESLSGPEKKLQKSIVGVHPVLTLALKNNELTLTGESALCEALNPLLGGFALFEAFRKIETAFSVTYQNPALDLSPRFGFFGLFSYDAVRYIETLPSLIAEDPDALPDVVLSIYQGLLYCDLKNNTSYWIWNDFQGLSSTSPPPVGRGEQPKDESSPPAATKITDSITKEAYFKGVQKALHHISMGDIYQIQLGHMLNIESAIDPFDVYLRMRKFNPSPFMYFATIAGFTLIGASPELCVHVKGNELIIRPLAGTIRRGKTPQEEQTLIATLQNDPKERAEHIMLVDLARNDIGRVCEVNTLKVTELMVVEAYSHVFHLVSNVVGQLAGGRDHYDAIMATFPAGTLTGAPKIRAMELIEEIETSRRGAYGGCVGFIDFRGNTELAICIRTAVYKNGHYQIRASAGIVADSTPEQEWQETLSKLGSSYFAITGRELKNENLAD